ncbi:MAG: hypothetical protein H7Z19_15230 [Chitinophagaceae bacterium]|nr:hypothetical protein [Rubrivivax sp.]
MKHRQLLAVSLLTLGGLSAAHATTVNVVAGSWYDFNVDDFLAPASSPLAWIDYNDNSLLSFQFTIAPGDQGSLTVVDAVTAGEVFPVFANGLALGTTTFSGSSSVNVGNNYDAALANAAFSRGVYTLAAGSYLVTGVMLATPDNINVTQGGLRLDVSVVPEVSSQALWLAGLAVVGLLARRRAL